MKVSQVAGLAAGWLAVALSMAAIGTASVGRVGVDTGGPRAQVTVTRTVIVGGSAPTSVAAAEIAAPTSAPTQPTAATVTSAQYVKAFTPARTTAAATRTSSVATPALPTSGLPGVPIVDIPVESSPVVSGPNVGVGRPDNGGTDSASPAVPTKGGTKHASGTPSTSAVAVGVSTSTWHRGQGAISAGCKASALTFLDPKPSNGYTASVQATWLGATITFSGPTTLSVLVRCSDGKPSFTILR